jgi:hypothetical protein
MNDTLVERLRYHSATLDRSLCMEAADRIEALEAGLREIMSLDDILMCRYAHLMCRYTRDIARVALDKDVET